MDVIVLFILILSYSDFTFSFSGEIVPFAEVFRCKKSEFFNSVHLKCTKCDEHRGLEPTEDRLSCTCGPQYRIVRWDGATFPDCEKCPPNYAVTSDGLDCAPCSKKSIKTSLNESSPCLACSSTEIKAERDLSGAVSTFKCIQCAANSTASADQRSCSRCMLLPLRGDCTCPLATHELIQNQFCIARTALSEWPDERGVYTIEYESGSKVDSQYLRKHLRLTAYQCKLRNHTACQSLGNMCAMVMFKEGYRGSPCNFFRDVKHIPTSETGHLPWLFYGEGDAPAVLSRKKIPTEYSLDRSSKNSVLNLTIAKYATDGKFLGMKPATVDMLQICSGSWGKIKFGTHYTHDCQVPASLLLETGSEPEFLELYLQYWEKGESQLYAIPVLTLNLKEGTKYVNKETDRSGWQLVRRFFLVEAVSGVGADAVSEAEGDAGSVNIPVTLQYAKSLHLKIKVQNGDEKGRVYPPLLVIEYGEILSDAIRGNAMTPLSFSISYEMDNNIAHAIEVSIIVLSVLSLVWAGIQTLSYSRRAGQVGVDLFTLLRLVLLTCGRLSDSFFIVVAGAAVHTFLFYKGQSVVHILLPGAYEEYYIVTYVIVAFFLKIVDVAHMVWHQISIDIFLMDWERPRASGNIPRPNPANQAASMPETQKVSIWRTYFVANEWNEIQTHRKTSLGLQLLLVLLCLKVFGWEQWALSTPDSFIERESLHTSRSNLVCRFALGLLIYMGIYIIQWLFMTGVYERFVKNMVQDFVDVCSIANVSVFILALENFGYYIHGRSAHGFADTDMQTMLGQLQREEDDLVGHRGLLPATEQQTFQMMVPPQLRACYRKVMPPVTVSNGPSRKRLSSVTGQRSSLGTAVDRSVQAYHSMNKLLAAFLEHALKDLDYEVRSKLFLESVLDMEFAQVQDKGVLYIDNGHSFDSVLFYGNEWTLLTFDLMLFTFTELLCGDYLLAAIVTGLVAQGLLTVRKVGGRKNLAKKTLIDMRFLI